MQSLTKIIDAALSHNIFYEYTQDIWENTNNKKEHRQDIEEYIQAI